MHIPMQRMTAQRRLLNAGASHAVHLYNAMPAFTHRAPGVVGAVADSSSVMAELICDGVHIHPAVVRGTFQMLGADRMILISDSMRATGMPDGRYTLGGLDVDVKGNRAVLVSDGALAGSATNLMDCMRTACEENGDPAGDGSSLRFHQSGKEPGSGSGKRFPCRREKSRYRAS